VFGQPGPDVGVRVGCVVIEDQVDLKALGDLAVDRLEERQELAVAMAWEALPDHRTGENVQRGEQRGGPVALVVMGGLLGQSRPDWQDRLGAVERLDLTLLDYPNAVDTRAAGRVSGRGSNDGS
jgi:hypothetical protein